MRKLLLATLIALVACGGGGASKPTARAGTATEPPQVAGARAKRDAICACTDGPCVQRVLDGPLGREVEGPPIEDPATLRLLLGLNQKTLECLYRVAGVPAACMAMVRTANTLFDCPALTDAHFDSLNEKLQITTGAWTETEWRALSAEDVQSHERACNEAAASMQSIAGECAPPQKK